MSALSLRREDLGAGRGRLVTDLGTAAIAEITWLEVSGVRVIDRTRVPPAFEGQGIAAAMTRAALEAARADGVSVRPDCSYVAAYIRRKPEWADLLAR